MVWENGEAYDLNDPDNTGVTGKIDQAYDIKNAGEVSGRSINPDTLVKVAIVAVPAR